MSGQFGRQAFAGGEQDALGEDMSDVDFGPGGLQLGQNAFGRSALVQQVARDLDQVRLQPTRQQGGAVVDAEGTEIGRVTSGGFSPTLEVPIAMAYVPATLAEPGTPVTLVQRGKLFPATVSPMPFVPHRYHRKGAVQ